MSHTLNFVDSATKATNASEISHECHYAATLAVDLFRNDQIQLSGELEIAKSKLNSSAQ